jgi:hypothetical protein
MDSACGGNGLDDDSLSRAGIVIAHVVSALAEPEMAFLALVVMS